MASPADARRRWWGAFYLTAAAALLIWGETVFKPILAQKWVFLFYWLVCFVLTGLAIFTALLDVWAMRRQLKTQQRNLVERTLAELDRGSSATPASEPHAKD